MIRPRGVADVVASMLNGASRARRCPACHEALIVFEGGWVCPNRVLLLNRLAGGAA